MKRRKVDLAQAPATLARGTDERFQAATPLRALLNKVFPDHWSFLLGEIALFSFIILLLTGVFLTLFFDPSMQEIAYDGAYPALRGTEMSAAYASSLHLSFEVRGGLFMRQMHHWAALLFMASIVVHMARMAPPERRPVAHHLGSCGRTRVRRPARRSAHIRRGS